MSGYKKYHPVNSLESPRFCGVKTFLRLPHLKTTEDVDFAAIGVPFDTACSYRVGARFGPSAIRHASSMIRTYNPGLSVDVYKYASGIDYGDINIIPGEIEESYAIIENEMDHIINAGVTPICLGGDHSITLPQLRSINKKHGPVALIHFDAHLDTGDSYFGKKYNHGTVFKRAYEEGLIDTSRSLSIGNRGSLYSADDRRDSEDLGIKVVPADEVRELGFAKVGEQIRERVGDHKAFFTFDIDFVDPAYAPGTGTLEVGGFTGYETLSLVREAKGLNIVGFDVVEVLPAFDPTEITAYLAANIGFEFASLIALKKKEELESA